MQAHPGPTPIVSLGHSSLAQEVELIQASLPSPHQKVEHSVEGCEAWERERNSAVLIHRSLSMRLPGTGIGLVLEPVHHRRAPCTKRLGQLRVLAHVAHTRSSRCSVQTSK